LIGQKYGGNLTQTYSTDNPHGFRSISECPCGTCARKHLPVFDHICIECQETNDWKNYSPNLDGRFEKKKEKPKREVFEFD
jgi:hypothetical protein